MASKQQMDINLLYPQEKDAEMAFHIHPPTPIRPAVNSDTYWTFPSASRII